MRCARVDKLETRHPQGALGEYAIEPLEEKDGVGVEAL
jgi:hypothetical protein